MKLQKSPIPQFVRASMLGLSLSAAVIGCQKRSDDFTHQSLKNRLEKVEHNEVMCPTLPLGTFNFSEEPDSRSTIVVSPGSSNLSYRITLNIEGQWVQAASNGEITCEQSLRSGLNVCVQASCVAPGKVTINSIADADGILSKSRLSLWSSEPSLSVQIENPGSAAVVRRYERAL